MTKTEIRRRHEDLKTSVGPPESPEHTREVQRRGRKFEQVIFHLLHHEGLEPELGPPHRGAQIDVSFRYDHRYFLLEARWRAGKVRPEETRNFQAKLKDRLVGTVGVFLAMSDYQPSAVALLNEGRVVLFDRSDWEWALSDSSSFSAVLGVKLRRLAAYGDAYYAYASHLKKLASKL